MTYWQRHILAYSLPACIFSSLQRSFTTSQRCGHVTLQLFHCAICYRGRRHSYRVEQIQTAERHCLVFYHHWYGLADHTSHGQRNTKLGGFRDCRGYWIRPTGTCFYIRAIGNSISYISIQFTATTFPILAALPVSDNASALSFFIFIRSFFQVRHFKIRRCHTNTIILFRSSHGVSPLAQQSCKISSEFACLSPTLPLCHLLVSN